MFCLRSYASTLYSTIYLLSNSKLRSSSSAAADGRDDGHLVPAFQRHLLPRGQVLLVQAEHKGAVQLLEGRELPWARGAQLGESWAQAPLAETTRLAAAQLPAMRSIDTAAILL